MMAAQPTRNADAHIRFYDGTSGTLLYYYSHKLGGLNARHILLISQAKKKAIKNSPYIYWSGYFN
jgi:hypothetical protein